MLACKATTQKVVAAGSLSLYRGFLKKRIHLEPRCWLSTSLGRVPAAPCARARASCSALCPGPRACNSAGAFQMEVQLPLLPQFTCSSVTVPECAYSRVVSTCVSPQSPEKGTEASVFSPTGLCVWCARKRGGL